MFKSKNYYVLWTISMYTTTLHSKFCKNCSLISIYKDNMGGLFVTNYFALAATPAKHVPLGQTHQDMGSRSTDHRLNKPLDTSTHHSSVMHWMVFFIGQQ